MPLARNWSNIVRLFTERGFASRVVRGRLQKLRRSDGAAPAPMRTEDRRVLEQVIFAQYLRDPYLKTVLFVGCDWYTAHYERDYFGAHDYWTIDSDSARRKFGAKQHVVGRLEDLGQHFAAGFFNLILCNGVYGWGLNRATDCDAAFLQCHACLADAGHLLIGWNDSPRWDPAPLSEVRSLAKFTAISFPPLGTHRYLTNTPYRHTYNFYQKPAAE